ncbi:hypothetical protein Gocc_0129 [Gaiella occulta]|uniref:Uncharacterized protein n=1 Tax=Gaiella occulta TaxID=1002870 RepID=A0A7M2Z0A6_9ACTN|nr:hypothetical protein [Gaiella occulta]RDI75710.1 hypothetical protein Gocc_0129 [Gaiella occulta]
MIPPLLLVVTGPPNRLLQVYATAPEELVLERFAARARTPGRHEGHADVAAIPEVEQGLATGRWRPLALSGELVELDSSGPIDLEPVEARVRTLCA